jgi:hypothetical protein
MKFLQNLVLVMTIFALGACGPELTRRYKSMAIESAIDGVNHVRVSSFVREAPNPTSGPVVLQLSAEGQASLIKAIAKADKSVTELYQHLAKGFTNQSANDVIDRSQMTIRVVFSTQKTEIVARPADRISSMQLRLENLPKDLQFQQWNRFETEYGEIDLGKIGLKKSTTANAKLSPTFGGSLVGTGEIGVTGVSGIQKDTKTGHGDSLKKWEEA